MERRGINHYHILIFHARLTHHQYPCVCGVLPKNYRVAPSPLDTQTAPCDTWHRSFHPDGNSHSFHSDVSHPEFFSADIPPGYLTSGILPPPGHLTSGILSVDIQPSSDISHPKFCLGDVPPFSPSLEHFLEVPKIPFSINLAAIFFSASNFRFFHDLKLF